jgi:hypothetical protein
VTLLTTKTTCWRTSEGKDLIRVDQDARDAYISVVRATPSELRDLAIAAGHAADAIELMAPATAEL